MENKIWDCIIIGGGPAGLSAALYLLRGKKEVFLLEAQNLGGQINSAPLVGNYPGIVSLKGSNLVDLFLEQLESLSFNWDLVNVKEITITEKQLFQIKGSEEEVFYSKSLILATGVKPRSLPFLSHDSPLIGNGIYSCVVCDGWLFKEQTVGVVGGGNSALEYALYLLTLKNKVIIFVQGSQFNGEGTLINKITTHPDVVVYYNKTIVNAQKQNDKLKIIYLDNKTKEKTTQEMAALFSAIGLIPENYNFSNLIDLDEKGYFRASENCTTKTPGVFVAGDARSKTVRQIVTAVSDGAIAAMGVVSYLNSLKNKN